MESSSLGWSAIITYWLQLGPVRAASVNHHLLRWYDTIVMCSCSFLTVSCACINQTQILPIWQPVKVNCSVNTSHAHTKRKDSKHSAAHFNKAKKAENALRLLKRAHREGEREWEGERESESAFDRFCFVFIFVLFDWLMDQSVDQLCLVYRSHYPA